MKLILNRPTIRPFKLIRRVFAYQGGYRWIVTDETTAGYGGVLAHGRRRRYMEARAEAAGKVRELEKV